MLTHRRTFVLFVVTTAVLCLHMCIVSQEAVAQNSAGTVSNVGTSSGAFLEIGVGARAQAMGGAYVALANDVSAMYWNPAGISRLDRIDVMFTFSNWLMDTRHTYAGIVFPLGGIGAIGAIGANITSFGMPDQPVRAIGQEEGTGEYYSAGDIALGVSFAYNLTDRFSLGINTKYINERIWHTSATGFALDIGALYQTQWRGLKMGFSLSNLGTGLQLSGRDLLNAIDPDKNNSGVDNINVNYNTGEFPLPLTFRFGLSQQFEVVSEQHVVTVSADVLHPSNNVESINVGLEYMLFKMIAMRAGYESLLDQNRINGLTFGFGISADFYGGIGTYFDYAYADWGVFNAVHRISLRMKF